MPLGCDIFRRTVNRRTFLQLGGAGLFGLTFADVLRAQTTGQRQRARQAIFIFLQGGPPHQDMFDMKPDQPADVRGPFRPIRTNVPGLDICEHLPKLAQTANLYTVLRSVNSRGYPHAGDHRAGLSWKTGNPRALRGTPKFPMYGSVVSRLRSGPNDMPNFVAMGDIASMAQGLQENYLGPAYDPLYVELARDARQPDPLTQIIVPQSIAPAEFERNIDLVRNLDRQSRQLDAAAPLITGMDQFQRRAFDILRSPRLREALALDREPVRNRERYMVTMQGYSRQNYTSRVLASRRLIEAGVPFVYVDFPYWDWHGGVEDSGRAGWASLAGLDASLSSLLVDLQERGLLDTTLVVVLGEMGRTPRVSRNGVAAREHWGNSQFVLMAGGGVQAGRIVGATDAQAAYVRDAEYRLASLGKTMYHLLGLDPDQELHTTDNRPLKLITEDVPLIREVL